MGIQVTDRRERQGSITPPQVALGVRIADLELLLKQAVAFLEDIARGEANQGSPTAHRIAQEIHAALANTPTQVMGQSR